MSEWISVKDQLPPVDEDILLYTDRGIFSGYCQEESWMGNKVIEVPKTITTKKGTTYTRMQTKIEKTKESGIIFHSLAEPFNDCCRGNEDFTVTHWMPLPSEPKDK